MAHFTGRTDRYQCEHRLRAKNGEWRWVLARGKVTVYDAQGHPLRFAGTHTDIHCRKQTEQTLAALNVHLERELAERVANDAEIRASPLSGRKSQPG